MSQELICCNDQYVVTCFEVRPMLVATPVRACVRACVRAYMRVRTSTRACFLEHIVMPMYHIHDISVSMTNMLPAVADDSLPCV